MWNTEKCLLSLLTSVRNKQVIKKEKECMSFSSGQAKLSVILGCRYGRAPLYMYYQQYDCEVVTLHIAYHTC